MPSTRPPRSASTRRLPLLLAALLVIVGGLLATASVAQGQIPLPPIEGGDGPPGGPPGSSSEGGDRPAVDEVEREDRRAAARWLLVEVAIIVDYEAFDVADDDLPPYLRYAWDSVDFPFDADDEDIMVLLDLADFEGRRAYLEIQARGIPVSAEVDLVMEALSDDDYDSVFFFDTPTNGIVTIPPETYEAAIVSLLRRPPDIDLLDEIDVVLEDLDLEEELADLVEEPDEPEVEETVPETTAPPSTEPAPPSSPPAAAPPPPEDEDGSQLLLVVLGGLAGVLVIAVVVVALLRRHPDPPPMAAAPVPGSTPSLRTQESVTNLLDVSRQLSGAKDAGEVQELAVRRGIDLANGNAGAFIVRGGDGLLPGYQSEDQLLVGPRLADGVIQRVVDTGQTISQVSQTEPALSNLPVALVAVPVIAGGQVIGVLVVLRNPSRPFPPEDVEHLEALAPVIASTFETATKLGSMEEMALVDGLTSLANRRRLDRYIEDVLAAAGQQSQSVAVVMIDVDHFKNFNDTQGHAAGDEVLRRVGRVLSQNVRPGDTAYRYGGEEFAVVLPNTDEATALSVANRVRVAIANESMPGEETQPGGRVTASLGVASGVGRGAKELFEAADANLYRAKEAGRNRVLGSE